MQSAPRRLFHKPALHVVTLQRAARVARAAEPDVSYPHGYVVSLLAVGRTTAYHGATWCYQGYAQARMMPFGWETAGEAHSLPDSHKQVTLARSCNLDPASASPRQHAALASRYKTNLFESAARSDCPPYAYRTPPTMRGDDGCIVCFWHALGHQPWYGGCR